MEQQHAPRPRMCLINRDVAVGWDTLRPWDMMDGKTLQELAHVPRSAAAAVSCTTVPSLNQLGWAFFKI